MAAPTPTPHRLAIRQLELTIVGGVVLAVPLSLLPAVAQHMPLSYSPNELGLLIRDWLGSSFALIATAILPASLASWLRLGFMRWLLAYCLTRRPAQRTWLAIAGTLVVFEFFVLLATLLGYVFLRQTVALGMCWWLCTGFSLPWLLAALGASWYVLRPPAPTRAAG